MPVNGLVTITPTSVAKTGTGSTATINTNGSVTFSSCQTLSLNGVFTSSYDNYMVSIRWTSSSGAYALDMRLRAGGTDNAGSAAYTTQYADIQSGIMSPNRVSSTASGTRWYISNTDSTQREGAVVYLFGPYLVQRTAARASSCFSTLNASMYEFAGTHNTSASYDGFTIYHDNNLTLTGLITVYGFNQ